VVAPKIVTSYWAKPIPDRRFDWSAVTEDYEAWYDDGAWHQSPIGYGETEQQAIEALLEQLDD
jgi:hypothetical protein